MIKVDYRTGSKELAPLFADFDIRAETTTLEFGDFSFEGNGPTGKCSVVLERKTIGDLIQSMQSRRLSGHQLPGMADAYDYCYLLVEGIWGPNQEGGIQIGQGAFGPTSYGGRWVGSYGQKLQYRAVDNYLATLELQAGVIYRRTLCAMETVFVIVDLYHWWNDKLWGEHSSHLGVYAPAVAKTGRTRLHLVTREIPLAEKWAMQLTGVDRRAQAIATHFGSARALANATEAQWRECEGIGPGIARQAVREINEQRDRTDGVSNRI